ncbi:PREDICTED: uncharacterized protein LOC109126397 [Camelina sativa]|uniref:Uncharacterized protein LOC109126397 n=1 Tax=Camelina sativa TaxID=90675 RepID=A0ABM1QFD1_CAMSA|nr:PREDICTED: uncharacterized protein LOC109126397 [Camelina sativa]
MTACNPYLTPVDTKPNSLRLTALLSLTRQCIEVSPVLFNTLLFTRSDISYAVQQVCLFMHDPHESHFTALKRILRYVKGTISHDLQLYKLSAMNLVAYYDADCAGCPTTRRSTSVLCIFFGDNLISWSAKRQHTVSRSSAEAEYRVVTNAVAEISWLWNLFLEMRCPLQKTSLVFL